MIKTKPENLIQ